MSYKRKYPSLTISEINNLNGLDNKSNKRYKFTEEECSAGGAEARWRERIKGVKLNHRIVFGKKERDV
jgi:hypothetical protein